MKSIVDTLNEKLDVWEGTYTNPINDVPAVAAAYDAMSQAEMDWDDARDRYADIVNGDIEASAEEKAGAKAAKADAGKRREDAKANYKQARRDARAAGAPDVATLTDD
jgi:hypothetical protein